MCFSSNNSEQPANVQQRSRNRSREPKGSTLNGQRLFPADALYCKMWGCARTASAGCAVGLSTDREPTNRHLGMTLPPSAYQSARALSACCTSHCCTWRCRTKAPPSLPPSPTYYAVHLTPMAGWCAAYLLVKAAARRDVFLNAFTCMHSSTSCALSCCMLP